MDVEEKLAKSNGILQYENEIILQLYHEDGLLILARWEGDKEVDLIGNDRNGLEV